MKWDAESDEKLKHLWLVEGLSATLIADRMELVSRSSVIGRVHRLKLNRPEGFQHLSTARLPSRNRYARAGEGAAPPRTDRAKRVRRDILVRQVEQPPKLKTKAPKSSNLTLIQLTSQTCKFAHGDSPDWNFCGALVKAGSPYCGHHHALCNRGAPPPKVTMRNSMWRPGILVETFGSAKR